MQLNKHLFCVQNTMIYSHLLLYLRSKGDSKARLRNLIFSVSLSRMRGKRRPCRAGVKLPHRCVGWRKTRGKVEKGKRETKSSTSGFVALRWWESRLDNRCEKGGKKTMEKDRWKRSYWFFCPIFYWFLFYNSTFRNIGFPFSKNT